VEISYLLPLLAAPITIIVYLLLCLVAPFVEETAKILGLILVREEEGPRFDVGGWMILGIFGALGFGLLENIMYSMMAFSEVGGSFAVHLFAIRTFTALTMHVISTSVAAYGFGRYACGGKFTSFLKYFGLAIIIHAAYNFTVSLLTPLY